MSGATGSSQPFVLRPLDFGEILDQTFLLYFRAWRPLLVLGAVATLPTVLLTGLLRSRMSVVQTPLGNWVIQMFGLISSGDMKSSLTALGWALLVLLVLLLLYPITNGAMIATCARIYLNQPTTLKDGWRIAARRYWPLLGTSLLFALVVIVAFPALVIGGLLVFAVFTIPAGYAVLNVYLAFRSHVIVVEGAGGGNKALTRSRRLAAGRFWPLLGLGLVFAVMAWVLIMIINYVVVLPLTFVQIFYAHAAFLGWITAVLEGAGSVLTIPLVVAGLTVTYYDMRVRKEGFDLEMAVMAQTNGPVSS